MATMIASYAKAIAQLPDPKLAKIVLIGLVATLILYALVYVAVGWGAHHILYRVDIFGWHPLTIFSEVLGGVAVFILTLLLFPAVATTVLSFLLEDVARAVEAAYYPSLGVVRRQGFGELLWQAVRFMLVMLVINIVGLIFYIPLAIFFGLGAALYFIINGYLLGREYFELVAMRRLDRRTADALRRAHLGRVWLGGIVLAFVSTVPFLNLLAPVIGTAAMLHEFEALRSRDGLV
ncbi:MAG TPA: EI24 domain-containing protein [Magnetospirillaceae bacterium]|jgi:uncharacterized protein involved in cysteine biosynthesis